MTTSISMNRNSVAALVAIFFLFAAAVTNLKNYPIENDEFRTLNHIEPVWLTQARTIPETIHSVRSLSPQHGAVYFLVLNVWHKMVGSDLFSLRLLSTFFGVLTIATVHRLANVTGRRSDGPAAALALSFLAFYMFHVQYLRMYTLLSFISAGALWSYWVASHSRSRRGWIWIVLVLSIGLIPYIHYLGSLVVAAIGIYHLAFARKDKRWWQILGAMAIGALMFLPWLPVFISGLAGHQTDLGATYARLTSFEAIRAVMSVLSNGILFIPPLVAGLAVVHFKRLSEAEKYLGFVTIFAAAAMFGLNEIAPILVENRMRYTVFLAVPYSCLAVIALRRLPMWRTLRYAFLVAWCASFFYYLGADDYAIYTNIQQHETEKIPRYQDFIYESESLPGHNELILSFHPNMRLSSNKTLPYYRKVIPDWEYIVHITYDKDGELIIQSDHSRYGTLEDIADNSDSIWVLHNPGQSALADLPVYSGWFLDHFKMCKRFRETETSIIDYYVTLAIPCRLIDDDSPFTVHFDNGFVLANAVTEQTSNDLEIYLWWETTIGKEYSVSLQLYDQAMTKVGQRDAVISRGPIDVFRFDLSELSDGEYSVQLIMYHFKTGKSVGGVITAEQAPFDRSVTLARVLLDGQT